jgi:hypothetical protein
MSSELSGKKAILLVAAAIVGIFFVLQALFGFPIFKPKSDIVDNSAVVIIKDQVTDHASWKHQTRYLDLYRNALMKKMM